ncbi:EamA family transporter RarD [Streptomycetaceae bacterium NBC_01309]
MTKADTRGAPTPSTTIESTAAESREAASERRAGLGLTISAQVVWGLQPLFLPLLAAMSTLEILAHRVLWSWLAVSALVASRRTTRHGVRRLVRNLRAVLTLAACGMTMGLTWGLYIYGIVTGRVVETSLSLFIQPLVTAVLGVVVLRERLRPPQWAAAGIATAGVVALGWGYGRIPWMALLIAVTLALYGLIKKRLAAAALEGMAVETVFLVPVAAAVLAWCASAGELTSVSWSLAALIPVAGVMAVLPLILVSAAVNRVPLATFGLLSYLNPVMQFALGAWVLGEAVTPMRWCGFGLLWAALAVFAVDALRATGAQLPRLRSGALWLSTSSMARICHLDGRLAAMSAPVQAMAAGPEPQLAGARPSLGR